MSGKRRAEGVTINGGDRVHVDLPDFTGMAGFVDRDALAYLSYRSNAKSARRMPEIGPTVEIGGRSWPVESVTESPRNPGFRIIALRKDA